MDFSLKEPKERTLEERQREMREDFQAGRSVVAALVAVEIEDGGLVLAVFRIKRNCFGFSFCCS